MRPTGYPASNRDRTQVNGRLRVDGGGRPGRAAVRHGHAAELIGVGRYWLSGPQFSMGVTPMVSA
jgi:hypothetical protein